MADVATEVGLGQPGMHAQLQGIHGFWIICSYSLSQG